MSEPFKFDFPASASTCKVINNISGVDDNIPTETMIFGANYDFAREFGGPLTQKVINALEEKIDNFRLRNPLIDTRVHMLMPGMYPAIPGWHCDHKLRNSYDSQPNLFDTTNNENYAVTVSSRQGGTSNTLFLSKPVNNVIVDPDNVWKSVSESVENHHKFYRVLPDGCIIKFGSNDLHSASPAHQRGWRFFFRASIIKNPTFQNQIRKQVQVYTTSSAGW